MSTRPTRVVRLQDLSSDEVPAELQLDAFFSPEHRLQFQHSALFNNCHHVFAVLDALHPYLTSYFDHIATYLPDPSSLTVLTASANAQTPHDPWKFPSNCIDPTHSVQIVVCPNVDPCTFAPNKLLHLPKHSNAGTPPMHSETATASSPSTTSVSGASSVPVPQLIVGSGTMVLGGVFDLTDGSIHLGNNVRVEPGVHIKGPCVIGDGCTLRSGAYLRGDVLVGRDVVLRGELKHVVIMDQAELCHPGYCGDSLCGFRSHFGNQVTTANLNLFYQQQQPQATLSIDVDGTRFDTGRKKIGMILGDFSQIGCSSVSDPCTLVHHHTVVYPLTRLNKGRYGPHVIVKNKPMEKGIVEIAPRS